MNRTSLPYRARIWVPTQKADDALRADLEKAGPGYTEQHVFGSDGRTREPITVFEILYGDDDYELEPMLQSIVQNLLWGMRYGVPPVAENTFSERCVLLELNGRPYLYSL